MSADDDDLDALLDEALEENSAAERKAEQKAIEQHASREDASRILNAALVNTGGESLLVAANSNNPMAMVMPPGMDNPEQLRLMMTQLTAILTQTQQLESIDPNSPEAVGQEEKLLEMAKNLIGHAQSNVDDAEERAKIDSTMKALQRVQELTAQAKSGNNNSGSSTLQEEDPSITAELQKISQELQGHVDQTRSQIPGLNAAFAAAAAANQNQNNNSNNNSKSQTPSAGLPRMSEQDRLQFEAIVRQMQAQQSGNSSTAGEASSALSPEQQAALFAMLLAMRNEAEQQAQQGSSTSESSVNNPQQQQASQNGLQSYYNLIFAKFASIDQQYDVFFAGRAKVELATGKISQSDFDRYTQQQSVVKQLLDFKEKQQAMMEKVMRGEQDENDAANVGELNTIVEKLRMLGDPPAGFDV